MSFKKITIVATTTALTASLVLPSIASANVQTQKLTKSPIQVTTPGVQDELPISLNPATSTEQEDIARADALFKQTTTVLPDGTYKFDQQKAKALGLSAAEIAAANSYFKELSSNKFVSNSAVGEVEEGKIKVTLAVLKAGLKKNKTKIDKAIKSTIDKVPFVKAATKNKWKKAVTVVAILNIIDNFANFSGKVEDFIANKVIKKLIPGTPQWIADGIAKTLLLFIA